MPALMISVPPGGGERPTTPTTLLIFSLFSILNHKASSSFPGMGARSCKRQLAVVPSAWQSNKGTPSSVGAKSCLTLCGLWTVARQAPLSTGVSRQERWGGLPFPPFYSSKTLSPYLHLASENRGRFFSNTHARAKRSHAATKDPMCRSGNQDPSCHGEEGAQPRERTGSGGLQGEPQAESRGSTPPHPVTHSLTQSFIHSCAYSLSCSFTHSSIHSLIHLLVYCSFLHSHSLTRSLAHSFIHLCSYSLTHSLAHLSSHSVAHSFIHSLIYSLIHSLLLIHSLTLSFIHCSKMSAEDLLLPVTPLGTKSMQKTRADQGPHAPSLSPSKGDDTEQHASSVSHTTWRRDSVLRGEPVKQKAGETWSVPKRG